MYIDNHAMPKEQKSAEMRARERLLSTRIKEGVSNPVKRQRDTEYYIRARERDISADYTGIYRVSSI